MGRCSSKVKISQPAVAEAAGENDLINQKQSYATSTIILNFLLFLQSVQFSIYFSSLWTYLKQLEPDTEQIFFGWTVAAYSLGQLVTSPVLGYVSKMTGSSRRVFLCCIVGSVWANLLFIFADQFPTGKRYAIFASRLVMGAAAGMNGTAFSFVVVTSEENKRDRNISIATTCMSLGFIAGPVLQAFVSFLGYPGYEYLFIHLNLYTAPAYMTVLLLLVAFVLTCLKFKDYTTPSTNESDAAQLDVQPVHNKFSLVALIWCWFSVYAVLVNLDTICSPICSIYYSWSTETTTLYVSVLIGVGSLLSVMVYILHTYTLHKYDERNLIIIGTTVLLFSLLLSYPYSFWTTFSGKGLSCDYHWCSEENAVPLVVFVICVLLVFVGFPPVNVAISTLYAKVIGTREQAFLQSILNSAGGLSRLICPVAVMALFESHGARIVWLFTGSIAISTIILCLCCYRILIVPKVSIARTKIAS